MTKLGMVAESVERKTHLREIESLVPGVTGQINPPPDYTGTFWPSPEYAPCCPDYTPGYKTTWAGLWPEYVLA